MYDLISNTSIALQSSVESMQAVSQLYYQYQAAIETIHEKTQVNKNGRLLDENTKIKVKQPKRITGRQK